MFAPDEPLERVCNDSQPKLKLKPFIEFLQTTSIYGSAGALRHEPHLRITLSAADQRVHARPLRYTPLLKMRKAHLNWRLPTTCVPGRTQQPVPMLMLRGSCGT